LAVKKEKREQLLTLLCYLIIKSIDLFSFFYVVIIFNSFLN